MKKIFTAAIATVVLAACATETPYAPRADNGGYGFSEQRIEDNRYRITFRGNSLTSRETVENYLLFRAAELTLKSGYDYFVVVEEDTEKSTRYRVTDGPDPFFYGRGRPFPYYGYGYPWGPSFRDYDVRESARYTAIAYIVLYKGQKLNEANAYDARSVEQNLRPVILRPE